MSQINPVHTSYTMSLITFLIVSSRLRQDARDHLPSDFPTTILYAFPISPMRATRSDHLNLLDILTQKYFVKHTNYEDYRNKIVSY